MSVAVVRALDASGYPRFNPNRKHPLWWGVVGLILIESTVVCSFIASYFYLGIDARTWPPPGIAPPPLMLPTLNLALLLASCVTMWGASRAMSADRKTLFSVLAGASVVLAGTVLVLRAFQMQRFAYSWSSHAYGSIVWTITGFHFMHVVSAAIGTAVVFVLSLKKYFNPRRQLAIVVDTVYWYFVCAAWIPLYVTLYWVPRISGGG